MTHLRQTRYRKAEGKCDVQDIRWHHGHPRNTRSTAYEDQQKRA